MAVVGIQPSIWVCKYHKYYKQNICSVHLKLIKVKNNFGDFSGNPQKLPWIPRKFGLSKSPKYVPKPRNCFTRPHPENRRFSGFFPRKNPKNLPSPVPTPSPKILKKFPRPHPVPELRGGGRGSPGFDNIRLKWVHCNFGVFGVSVENPRYCVPRPRPENRRFSGFYPRKNPKTLPSPVPTPSPKILKSSPRPHPVPELRGGGQGSPGFGVTGNHSSPQGFREILRVP